MSALGAASSDRIPTQGRHPQRGKYWTGGGSGAQTLVYQKWPDQIFPTVHFVVSHDGPFGLWGGRGSKGEMTPPPPASYGHSNTSLPAAPHMPGQPRATAPVFANHAIALRELPLRPLGPCVSQVRCPAVRWGKCRDVH